MSATQTKHPQRAAAFTDNRERTKWHDQSLWFIRTKRDNQARSIPEWESLRSHAAAIKEHTISRLPEYLLQFEEQATAAGAIVHWARDAAEHNEIVLRLLQERDARKIVKSKSMLTEECHLNPFLERHGIEVVDTDLGERIVQLRGEPPSHIVVPAIHLKREDVGETFHQHLGTEAGASDPQYLTEAARQHLRDRFIQADAGITGVNFAIAETGEIVICTNEGNADLGTSIPPLHIASMGIEKIIPRRGDLSVFTRLLARSATGQPITTYTAHFRRPLPGKELHIVLVDNGRSRIRDNDQMRDALRCIRCGACMNTCPVYRRSGGHSYHAVVPGPIGSVLSPANDAAGHSDLPHACSLCGSCTDVCPVKIPLHHQLLAWRKELARRHLLSAPKRWSMRLASFVFRSPQRYALLGAVGRRLLRVAPRWAVYSPLNAWGRDRELPTPPRESFRDWWHAHQERDAAEHPTPPMSREDRHEQ